MEGRREFTKFASYPEIKIWKTIFQQVFEENLAINLDPEKLMYLFVYLLFIYLFISLFMYASGRCGTGLSFDAKIVKLG